MLQHRWLHQRIAVASIKVQEPAAQALKPRRLGGQDVRNLVRQLPGGHGRAAGYLLVFALPDGPGPRAPDDRK